MHAHMKISESSERFCLTLLSCSFHNQFRHVTAFFRPVNEESRVVVQHTMIIVLKTIQLAAKRSPEIKRSMTKVCRYD